VAEVGLDVRQRLQTYGECCGLAFQIADDLLDITGSDAKLGKETGRDQKLGKLTYPGSLGVDGSRQKATELVDEACDCLSVFEDKAEPLRQLAQFIVERDH
jgi:geranylgeranyl pyrophosphate synthase